MLMKLNLFLDAESMLNQVEDMVQHDDRFASF